MRELDSALELTARYDRDAEAYRELWAPILHQATLPLARALRGGSTHRILDVGTGVGTLLPDLSSLFPGALVLGVDRSSGMLTLAPHRFARACMDARDLGFRSESMDRVLLAFMLFHLGQPLVGLREARRVLRPGGRIGTLTWASELESTAIRIWTECLDHHGAIGPNPVTEAQHEVVDSSEKVAALMSLAGFDSPQSWTEEIVSTIGGEHLVRLRTSLGSSRTRFDSLSQDRAAACVEEARRRFADLKPPDFVARARVVYATASR